MIKLSSTIDCANPVNRTHWHNRDKLAWWLAIPGLMGGGKLHNLMSLPGDLSRASHGTLNNMVPGPTSGWQPANAQDGFGYLNFDGVDDNVTFSVPIPVFHTLAATVRLDAAGSFPMILAPTVAANPPELRFSSNTRKPEYAGTLDVISPTAIALGTWHRILGRASADASRLYVDGQEVGSTAGVPTAQSAIAVLGARSNNTLFLTGAIKDAQVWGRALSADEAWADYQLSLRGYPGALNRLSSAAWMKPPPVTGGPFPWFLDPAQAGGLSTLGY